MRAHGVVLFLGFLLVAASPGAAGSAKKGSDALGGDLALFAWEMGTEAELSERCGIINKRTLEAEVETMCRQAGYDRQGCVNSFRAEYRAGHIPGEPCDQRKLREQIDKTNAMRIRLLDAIGRQRR